MSHVDTVNHNLMTIIDKIISVERANKGASH